MSTPKSTEKQEPRASARSTKGIPPKRFTFSNEPSTTTPTTTPTTTTEMKKEDLEQPPATSIKPPVPKPRTSKSVPSVTSKTSTKSVARMIKESDVSFGEQIITKKRQMADLGKSQRETELEMKKVKRRIHFLQQEEMLFHSGKLTAEQLKELDFLEIDVLELEKKSADQQADIDLMQEELELLHAKKEVKQMAIEEDGDSDGSQSLDDSFATIPSNPSNVDNWLQRQGLATPFAPYYPPIATSTPFPPVSLQPATRPSPQPHQSATNEETAIEKLANVLGQALQSQSLNAQRDIIKIATGDKSLKEFNGDPQDWNLFKAEFYRTTDDFQLDDSQNITRLGKALTGAAFEYVQHLLHHVGNVQLIMESLEKRFGQPRFILDSLMQRVRECPPPSIENPDSIINFDMRVKSLVVNVQQAGNPMYLNSIELLNKVVGKLPPDMCDNWFEWSNLHSKAGNLEDFSEWLATRAKLAIQRVGTFFLSKDDRARRATRGPGGINAVSGEDTDDSQDSKPITCSNCQSANHYLVNCRKFQSLRVRERWEVMNDNYPRACIGCLSTDHVTRDCKQRKTCGIDGCTYRHHHLLHSTPRSRPTSPQPHQSTRQPTTPESRPTYPTGSVNHCMLQPSSSASRPVTNTGAGDCWSFGPS